MKANEVLRLLRITRPTLSKYVKDGIIEVVQLPTGRYDYVDESVFRFLNKGVSREICIYARIGGRVSVGALDNQIERLKQYCTVKGYNLSEVYSDISDGISFDRRIGFSKLLTRVLDNKVERVLVVSQDRLGRIGVDLLKQTFLSHGCKIEALSESSDRRLDGLEYDLDIEAFKLCYSNCLRG